MIKSATSAEAHGVLISIMYSLEFKTEETRRNTDLRFISATNAIAEMKESISTKRRTFSLRKRDRKPLKEYMVTEISLCKFSVRTGLIEEVILWKNTEANS